VEYESTNYGKYERRLSLLLGVSCEYSSSKYCLNCIYKFHVLLICICLLTVAYRQIIVYVNILNRALYLYSEAVWLSVNNNIIPDTISRYIRFLTLVWPDMSNIYSMYMTLWGHVSNKAFMSIFDRDGQ